MKNIIKEFKNFAIRGSMMDMAIGIIIGTAFGKIVDSLVKDVIMPLICTLLGQIDLENLFFIIKKGHVPEPYDSLISAKAAGAVTLNLGTFLNSVINFTIVAFGAFIIIKVANAANMSLTTASSKSCPYCDSSIPIKATRCPKCTADISMTAEDPDA